MIEKYDAVEVDMHANLLTVSPEVVRELVDEQFAEWRSLPFRAVAAAGTVKAIFRIGDRFAARFPAEAKGYRVGAALVGVGGGGRARTGES
jgi:Na+/H+ antiporter NhaA